MWQNITDPKGKANLFNSYFSSLFSIKGNILLIGRINTIKPFTTDIRTIRRRTKTIGKRKSVGPDGIPGVILKMGGEATILYLACLLELTINNGILPEDWKKATVIPIHKGGGGTNHKLQITDR